MAVVDHSGVVVALSGGVDSSVTAVLLQKKGWDVKGLHLLLPGTSEKRSLKRNMIERIGKRLRIPVFFLNLEEEFTQRVINPFVDAYLSHLTPNPCVRCNPGIKFPHLLSFADTMGISNVATGHYAVIREGKNGDMELLRGMDRGKDQSYFLHRLNQSQLAHILFPLGRMTKSEVRQLAIELDLPNQSEPESQEICFLNGKDYRVFLEERLGKEINKKGDIIDGSGMKVGEHQGTHRYTIGQRHGLGIASARPFYVMEIRAEQNQVVVGRKEDLFSRIVMAEAFHWIAEGPSRKTMKVLAQVRNRHHPAPGWLEVASSQEARLVYDDPQWAISPGQALVCYDGDQVLGGGWITRGG